MSGALEQAERGLDRLEGEVQAAMAHLQTCRIHLAQREVPRYAAHLLATQGHLHQAQRTLDELTILHASQSSPNVEAAR